MLTALLPLLVPPPSAAAPAAAAPVVAQQGPAVPAPAGRPVDDDVPVAVEVERLAPRAPSAADEAVQVVGRLVNRGDRPVGGLTVRLLVDDVVISRSALARAEADPGTGRPRGPSALPADEQLAPGESTTFDLRMQVSDLRLRRVGVYPIEVQARGRLAEARRTATLGRATTFVPWFPDGPPRPTRLAFLLPLVGVPERTPDGALLGTDTLEALSEGGRLADVLAAVTAGAGGGCDPPGALPSDAPPPVPPAPAAPVPPPCRGEPVPVTFAVDPDLLETAQALAGEHVVLTGDDARVATPGHRAAGQWLAALREAVAVDPAGDAPAADVLPLPFADPDVVATARVRAGLLRDLEQLRELGTLTVADLLEAEPLETVAWPPPGPLTPAALDVLVGDGAGAVVLDAAALPARGPLVGRTPGARTPLNATVAGPVDGLVVDDGLSRLLTAGPGDPAWQGDRLAEQRWIAETAILAAERPGESRTLLVAPERRAPLRPGVVAEALSDAGRLPWLCGVALADVVEGDERCALEAADAPPDRLDDRGELLPAGGDGLLSPGFLQAVAAVRVRAEQLTEEVLLPGTEAAARTTSRLLRARGRTLSSAWRDDPGEGRRMLALQRAEVDGLRSQVQLVTSGRVLLTSDTGVVEVGLSNALDQPVTVGVALNDPVEARLTSTDTGLQTVAPGQQVQVRVRVEARVSGQFVVRATLLDRAGRPFGDGVELVARSTRYGRLALAVTGVAAGVLLVAVGVRLVRRALPSAAGPPDLHG